MLAKYNFLHSFCLLQERQSLRGSVHLRLQKSFPQAHCWSQERLLIIFELCPQYFDLLFFHLKIFWSKTGFSKTVAFSFAFYMKPMFFNYYLFTKCCVQFFLGRVLNFIKFSFAINHCLRVISQKAILRNFILWLHLFWWRIAFFCCWRLSARDESLDCTVFLKKVEFLECP